MVIRLFILPQHASLEERIFKNITINGTNYVHERSVNHDVYVCLRASKFIQSAIPFIKPWLQPPSPAWSQGTRATLAPDGLRIRWQFCWSVIPCYTGYRSVIPHMLQSLGFHVNLSTADVQTLGIRRLTGYHLPVRAPSGLALAVSFALTHVDMQSEAQRAQRCVCLFQGLEHGNDPRDSPLASKVRLLRLSLCESTASLPGTFTYYVHIMYSIFWYSYITKLRELSPKKNDSFARIFPWPRHPLP